MTPPLRIGTRGSKLALAQAEIVRAGLAGQGCPSVIVPISTTGDRVLDRPLAEIGGKGLFTREIDRAVLEGHIDCAVHSMKDMETLLTPGTMIAAVLERADPRDFLVGTDSIAALRPGARIGTSAVRRRAQLLRLRADLQIVPLRGNVDTRLARLEAGDFDAIILAKAGLDRLARSGLSGAPLAIDVMLPAVAQGAIAVTVQADNTAAHAAAAALNHLPTEICVTAERALLEGLDGSCRTPIAAHARLEDGGGLVLHGAFYSAEGDEAVSSSVSGRQERARALGLELAARLRAAASASLLASLAPIAST